MERKKEKKIDYCLSVCNFIIKLITNNVVLEIYDCEETNLITVTASWSNMDASSTSESLFFALRDIVALLFGQDEVDSLTK